MKAPPWSWQGRLACSGVLAGHCLTHYTLRSPETTFHHPMSASGGHSAGFVVAGLVAASATAGLVGFIAERGSDATDRTLVSRMAARLAWLQCTGFLALEVAERLVMSPQPLARTLHHLPTDPAVLLGLLLQLGLTAVIAVVITLAVEVVVRARRAPTSHSGVGLALRTPPAAPPLRACAAVTGRTSRGPPGSSIATA